MKILFAGESWELQETHMKGFDTVSMNRLVTDWAQPAFDAIRAGGMEMDYMPSHIAQTEFPETPEALAGYDAVVLSDIGSNTLLLDPHMQFAFQPKPNRLAAIAEYVKRGGGLVMFGGYLSFSGFENKARYGMTPLAAVLPVTLLNWDDRIETPEGAVPVMTQPGHPVLRGLPDGAWPAFLGYNRIAARPEAQTIATIGGDTFMAAMTCGRGRSFAFASDCVGHWGSKAFMEWPGYARLLQNILRWVAGEI